MSLKQIVGRLGEDIACKFLKDKGFSVIDRNYSEPWGELDIIAKKNGVIHFIEVKSVSCETLPIEKIIQKYREYDPSDNINNKKKTCLSRIIETYLNKKEIENYWQIDVIEVFLNEKQKKAVVNIIENIDLI